MHALALTLASVRVIGWMLLHSIWQAAVLGLAYAALRSVLPRGEARYRLGMAVLVALAMCPLLTGWWLLGPSSPVDHVSIGMVTAMHAGSAAVGMGITTSPWANWDRVFDALSPWVVLAWSAGVLFLSIRAAHQWHRLNTLIGTAGRAPAWQRRIDEMVTDFGLRRRVSVLCSKVVDAPVLVGWIRPVILLPMAVACGFPAAQVELILAHELAHLRRLDPYANVFQVILETLYFYHPVVHWISRDVRNEREICCDALALQISGGSRREFATTLAALGELRESRGTLLLAANGGVLLDRVQQIVGAQRQGAAHLWPPASRAAVLLGAVLIALVLRAEWHPLRLQEIWADTPIDLPSAIAPLVIIQDRSRIAAPKITVAALRLLQPRVSPTRTSPTEEAARRPQLTRVLPPTVMAPEATLPTGSSATGVVPPEMTAGKSIEPTAVPAAAPSPLPAAAPTPVHIQQPVYPREAMTQGIEGKVVLEFALATDGRVQDLRVVRAEPAGIFDQAATRAMRGWRYAAPPDSALHRRYRQAMVFTLDVGSDRHRGASSRRRATGEKIDAQTHCRVVTGTHICRWPDGRAGVVGRSAYQGAEAIDWRRSN